MNMFKYVLCFLIFFISELYAERSPFNKFTEINHYSVSNQIGEHYNIPKARKDVEDLFYKDHRYTGKIMLFPLGILGGYGCAIEGRNSFTVFEVFEGGLLGKAGVKKWDEVTHINGEKPEALSPDWTVGEGPAELLGNAIDQSEKSGRLVLKITSGDKISDLTIAVPQSSSFLHGFPENCQKSSDLRRSIRENLINSQHPSGKWRTSYTTCLVGLSLLADGDKNSLKAIKRAAGYIIKTYSQIGEVNKSEHNNTWVLTLSMIFLSEYVAATGDTDAFSALQKLSDLLEDKFINVYGGFGHYCQRKNFTIGAYGKKNFGATAVMALLAWELSQKVGCKVDSTKINKAYDLIRGSKPLKNNVSLAYDGQLEFKDGLQGSGFRSAALSLFLDSADKDEALNKELISTLNRHYKGFGYVHSTPSHGWVFGHWAMQRQKPSNYNKYLEYKKWHVALSKLPDGSFHYINPKRARMAIPGGGGWDGDTYIGVNLLAQLQNLIFLNSHKMNLFLLGNQKFCWLNGSSESRFKTTVKEIQMTWINKKLAESRMLISDKKYLDAYISLKVMANRHENSEAKSLIENLNKDKNLNELFQNYEYEKAAMKYYEMGTREDQYHKFAEGMKFRQKHFDVLFKLYPNSDAAKKAQKFLEQNNKK